MLYSQKEEYIFHLPQEYKYYLDFKQNLIDLGLKFIEFGTATSQTIQIHNTAIFNNGELVSTIKADG